MPRKKVYTLPSSNVAELIVSTSGPWEVITPWATYDFRRWLYLARTQSCEADTKTKLVRIDRDEIVIAVREAIKRLKQTMTDHSVYHLCASGVASWFDFLDWIYDRGKKIISLEEIDVEVIERYIEWLRFRTADTETGRLSYSAAKSVYSRTKSVLIECVNVGEINRGIFPKNPFPNSNRSRKSFKPYSKDEMLRLLSALSIDLLQIRQGVFEGTESDKLAVYFFIMATRTGRNPTPLLEMTRDALQPHPLNPKTRSLLTLYKRRGNNISLQEFRKTISIEGPATVRSDVTSLFKDVIKLTEQYVSSVPEKVRNRLWLCRRETTNQHRGLIAPIDTGVLHRAAKRLIELHDLKADNIDPKTGQAAPLQLTTMRLRKTFATRMWQLTGGDLVKTAEALGNQPRITDAHYLEVTPEMERHHKFVGLCLDATLRGKENDQETKEQLASELRVTIKDVERILNGKNNTGVGRCTSPYFGDYAPKDGKNACTSFLYCFQCSNQVVMESDLYRLFSFYWLIIKERNFMERKSWKKIYGWVIREVDRVISPRFNKKAITEAREHALINPHPMWRDRAILGGAYE
ncbi:MAG: integrase [Dissulfurispiraceae bacterium]